MTKAHDPEAHRSFLNRLYGPSRHFYDLTRKYYLFGRDSALKALLLQPWASLVEIGPGTGRNLKQLYEARPDAAYGGVEASDAMLAHARARCPFAHLRHGFAESADLSEPLGVAPDRILFSYALSMMQDPDTALAQARRQVAEHGEVWVVDFADLASLPRPARSGLRRWLEAFHVHPLPSRLLEDGQPIRVDYGFGRYWVRARFSALRD